MARLLPFVSFVWVTLAACSSGNTPAPPPPCDATCQDNVAVQSLRDAIKLAYNVGLQGKPVGAQDASAPCPLGGHAHVLGQATSNAEQGSTEVSLTYAFTDCQFAQVDTNAHQTYSMTVTGTITEDGTLAVQPSSTTALRFASDAMTFNGTVYTPPIPYSADACPLKLGQNGNALAGTLCGRAIGLSL